ncbi:hypothetical protein ABZ853_15275 [Streptomyces albidoflavus]
MGQGRGWGGRRKAEKQGGAHGEADRDAADRGPVLLDQVHPAPPDDPWRTEITRTSLAALWATYAALGHHRHLRRSAHAARRLDAQAPEGTVRVATDGRGVREVAAEVAALTGWLD